MWEKAGLIFNVENTNAWMISHACVPTVLELPGERLRIYFAPRNAKGQSMPTFIEVNAINPGEILYVHQDPVLTLGKLGTFDDGGIMPCSLVKDGDQVFLYYVGWNPSVSVPYRNSIGLAASEDGGLTFKRMYDGPIVDRNRNEPYFTASPYVLKEDKLWHMWYASSTGFVVVNEKPEPLYVIKYASSHDGIDWKRDDITAIFPVNKFEANARPTVISEDNIYKMWYCYRGSFDYRDGYDSYRIGYAESDNGINWKRVDKDAGISLSAEGWDSTMLCYPNVIIYKGQKILFYNGNGFGKTGIGYATWKP